MSAVKKKLTPEKDTKNSLKISLNSAEYEEETNDEVSEYSKNFAEKIIKDKTGKIKYPQKRNRVFSMNVSAPKLILEESEEILKLISKKQRKLSDYSKDKNEDNISFSGRENIIEWAHTVLNSIILTKLEKSSIFHRFCTAYDLVMNKLYTKGEAIEDETKLKILTITIFLLAYKLEGFSIAKITISSLVEAFLNDLEISQDKLSQQVFEDEIKIIHLIDFNPLIFEDNNLHQLTFLLFDLFIKKYTQLLAKSEKKMIENYFIIINQEIEFSDGEIFDILGIDKAFISLYSSINYYASNKNNEKGAEIIECLKEFYEYLTGEKIIKIKEKYLLRYVSTYKNILNDKLIEIQNEEE